MAGSPNPEDNQPMSELKAFAIEERIFRQRQRSPLSRLVDRLVRYRELYILIFPVMFLYGLFSYVPMYGVTLAFKDFDYVSIWSSPWIGLGWFEELFRNSAFWSSFRNSLEISLLRLACGFPVPIIIALLLNEARSRHFKNTIQTLTFLPYLLSWAVMGLIVTALFSQTEGPVNGILELAGGKRQDFLHSNDWFRFVLILTGIWHQLGFGLVIYLAGLASIDQELQEAAMIDGAGRFRRMWHITIPGLMPVIFTNFIFAIGALMGAGFEQVFVLYSPLVYQTGDIIETFVYRNGVIDGNYSLATATGLFQNVIGLTLLLFANWVSGRVANRRMF
jgi:putative aldouronate transport system permease protein